MLILDVQQQTEVFQGRDGADLLLRVLAHEGAQKTSHDSSSDSCNDNRKETTLTGVGNRSLLVRRVCGEKSGNIEKLRNDRFNLVGCAKASVVIRRVSSEGSD